MKGSEDSWLPLSGDSTSGLGFDFALIRGGASLRTSLGRRALGAVLLGVDADLAAVSRLDEVRTVELTLSREHLNPPASGLGLSM